MNKSHELFLTTRQTTKIGSAFANNTSGVSFGSWLSNLGKKALTNTAIPLARDNLSGSVSNLTSNYNK